MKKYLALICFVVVSLLFTLEDAFADRLRLNAVYTVPPTAETAELGHNQFLITDYEVDTAQVDRESMRFVLPLDLTAGQSVEIQMQVVSRVEKTRTLQGERGEATCKGPWFAMNCSFKFKNLPPVDSTPYLQSKYGVEGAIPFAKVARAFGNDPIGTGALKPADRTFIGNGVWKLKPSALTQSLPARLELENERGTLFWAQGRLQIESLTYSGILARGVWKQSDRQGFVTLEFTQDRVKAVIQFEGSNSEVSLAGKR